MYVPSFMSYLLVIVIHKYKQATFNRMKYGKYEQLHVSITPLTDSHHKLSTDNPSAYFWTSRCNALWLWVMLYVHR